MHPQIVADKPGECPICGMALVSILGTPGESGKPGIPGLAQVTIPTDLRQRMGLTLGQVEKRSLTRHLRLPARIVPDETRQVRVTTKIEGFVETLLVSATGQAVKKGAPLLTIYSPALMAAQEEYRIALQSGLKPLIEASRQRLHSWDLSEAQMAALETTNRIERTLTIYSQADGVVTEKAVLAGQKIMPGDSLMVVTDCSVVWAEVDVAESEVSLIRIGLPVELSFPYWPGKTFMGEVSFLPPGLTSETHTLKARLTVPNADGLIKLGMYADAGLRVPGGERTVVPESAVIQTGTHSYVFRDDGEGKLTPVEIKVGLRSGGVYEVLEGLAEGARVVISANFLVDSESSIRAVIEGNADVKKP
jgi:Cu(I)/Ag(I) efflux system membrane fusion protein